MNELSPRAQSIISELELQAHPEGGWFRETYRSDITVSSAAAGAQRSAMTDIYFLLCAGQVSRLHRVLHDEVWHYYEGAPLRLYLARIDGSYERAFTIGRRGEADGFKQVVPAGCWQAAESTGGYTLVGCTVAPGFDFADFSFIKDHEAEAARFRVTAPNLAGLV